MMALVAAGTGLLVLATTAVGIEEICSNESSGNSMLATKKILSKVPSAERDGAAPARVDAREWELFQLYNKLRAQGFTCPGGHVFEANSNPLVFDCRLWRAAYLHSKDMADNDYTGHTSKDGRTPVDRAKEQGVPPWEHRNMECLGSGPSGAQEVLDGWKGSTAHCITMMHPTVTMFGAGYASNPTSYWRHYWTLMLSWSSTGLDESCYPDPTPTIPAPTTSAQLDCDLWMVSPGFARIKGPWSGDCRHEDFPDTCYFRYIAKADDGFFIAGMQIEQYFKMVKFDAHGANQPGTGKYYVGSPPEDAAAMVSKYATANSAPGSNYIFVKLDGFSCEE